MTAERQTRGFLDGLRLLVLVAASASLSLGAVELLLRGGVIRTEYYLRNEVLGDAQHAGPRLFIIGDSFIARIQGSNVENYLYPLLAPSGARIRNTATAGWGPLEYLQSLRQEGPQFRPDVVLLSYYVGNDLLDVGCRGHVDERLRAMRAPPAWKRLYLVQFLKERLRGLRPGRVMLQSATSNLELWALRLLGVSAPTSLDPSLATALDQGAPFTVAVGSAPSPLERRRRALGAQAVDYDRMRRVGIPQNYIESAKAGELNPWIVSLGAVYPDYFRDELLMKSACAQRAWADVQRVLDMILATATELHTHVMPVLFPHTLQVSTAHYALYRAWKINVDDEMLTTRRPQQLLHDYFHSRGIEPLDLLEAFRASRERLYWDQDEHMNQRGQQLAAERIAEAFLKRFGNGARVAGHPN